MLAAMGLCVAGCVVLGYLLGRKMRQPVAVVFAGVVAAAMLLFGKFLSDSLFVASIVPPRMLPCGTLWGGCKASSSSE